MQPMQGQPGQFAIDAGQPMNVMAAPPVAVYGLQIANPRLASLTRKVLTVAWLSAMLATGQTIYALVAQSIPQPGGVASALCGLALALLVPACGYCGAKNSDRNLTCCFCGCNCLGGFLSLFAVGSLYFGFHELGLIVDNCDPTQNNADCLLNMPDGSDAAWNAICELFGFKGEKNVIDNPASKLQCYEHISTSMQAIKTMLIVQAIITIPLFILHCLGFIWGNQLYSELKGGQVVHVAPQYATNPVQVQPQIQPMYAPNPVQAQPQAQPVYTPYQS